MLKIISNIAPLVLILEVNGRDRIVGDTEVLASWKEV